MRRECGWHPSQATYALVGSLGLLGLLALGHSSLACSSSDLRLLGTLSADGIPGSTNDSTFMLDSAASALLGNLFRDALLVHATVDNSPVDLARVQTLQEVRLALAVDEAEGLITKSVLV
jgi:hypothetical protein